MIFLAGVAAGGINSVAGGGTIISFPALVGLGLPPVHANATSMVALWPGNVTGALGFRDEIRASGKWGLILLVPAIIGGLAGAVLLERLPAAFFSVIAPWMILAATLLIGIDPVMRRVLARVFGTSRGGGAHFAGWLVIAVVTIYGGYFGAGMGILVLTALGLLGITEIHRANGLKNVFMTANKGCAAAYFIATGLVHWSAVILMAAGATIGGYGAARLGRRLGEMTMRVTIVVIGIAMFAWMLYAGK